MHSAVTRFGRSHVEKDLVFVVVLLSQQVVKLLAGVHTPIGPVLTRFHGALATYDPLRRRS